MRPTAAVLCSVLFAAMFSASPSSGGVSTPVSLNQLIRSASVIVEGDVVAMRGNWSPDHTRIYTTITLDVSQVHKGTLTGQTLDLRVLGGTVDDMTLAVVEQPHFKTGERVFLFLSPNYQTRDIPFVGGEAGKMSIVPNATGADVLLGVNATFEKSDVTRNIRSILRPIGQ
jgi:hypothetical protein